MRLRFVRRCEGGGGLNHQKASACSFENIRPSWPGARQRNPATQSILNAAQGRAAFDGLAAETVVPVIPGWPVRTAVRPAMTGGLSGGMAFVGWWVEGLEGWWFDFLNHQDAGPCTQKTLVMAGGAAAQPGHPENPQCF
jgi:hypothetical protein